MSFLVVIIDQVSKFFVRQKVRLYSQKVIIPHFLNLVHIKNKGIAFGIFNSQGMMSYLLVIISLFAVGFIIYLIITEKKKDFFMSLSLGMILGGAIGNLLDRVCFGEVTDFIDVHVRNFHWPAFNVADMAITTGATLALFLMMKSND